MRNPRTPLHSKKNNICANIHLFSFMIREVPGRERRETLNYAEKTIVKKHEEKTSAHHTPLYIHDGKYQERRNNINLN